MLSTDASFAKTNSSRYYASYARYATGISIFGSPKDWDKYAARYGYYVSDRPVVGGVATFEPGAYNIDYKYGFVGLVIYYRDDVSYWRIGVRYAGSDGDASQEYDYLDVSEKEYRVAKGDQAVHYIYRYYPNATSSAYYTWSEYVDSGQVTTDRKYSASNEVKPLMVYSADDVVTAYFDQGQVVRTMCKAEVGETLWVFVESTNKPGVVFAKAPYYQNGRDGLQQFNPYTAAAQQMYYAKDYGDTVLDLGYEDYSKLASYGGKVTITVKKGSYAAYLKTIQTITLQVRDN
jgi:hypothetical protein